MRCMARFEVVVDRSVVYFKSFRVLCFQVIDEETHMCPIGNVPVDFLCFLRPIKSLLSKACLFSVKRFTSEISAFLRGVVRQQVPEEF